VRLLISTKAVQKLVAEVHLMQWPEGCVLFVTGQSRERPSQRLRTARYIVGNLHHRDPVAGVLPAAKGAWLEFCAIVRGDVVQGSREWML
jgi:hypothetical protein